MIQFLSLTLIEFLSFAYTGYVHASYEYDNSSFELEDLDRMYDDDRNAADDRDVLGSSQLGGAPPIQTQEPAFQIPVPTVCPA